MTGWLVSKDKLFTLTPVSLTMREGVSFEEWETTFQQVRRIQNALPYYVGDLLNYGEAHYGETYAQAVEDTGYSVQTLTNYKSVCSKVAPERRREGLNWTHHVLVAKFEPEEQECWLDRAEVNQWDTGELRVAIRSLEQIEAPKAEAKPIEVVEVEPIIEPVVEVAGAFPSSYPPLPWAREFTLTLSTSEVGILWTFFARREEEMAPSEQAVFEKIETLWLSI